MIRILALVALLVSVQDEEPAIRILREAMAKADDRAFLERSLAAVDEETRKNPKGANNHYARGWLLSRLKRGEEAVAAYDEANRVSPGFADALYNAGVVLAGLGKVDEALARWEAAIAANPKHVDAYYNAAQNYYNRKDFKRALDRWSKARALVPKDFDIVKKVLQAENALGDREAAAKTRLALFELRRTSEDPRIRQLKSYVFDQFDVGKAHIYVYETFEPEGDLYQVYRFQITDPSGKAVGSIDLESSAVIREAGTPYVLGMNVEGEHTTFSIGYKALPAYTDLKETVTPLIEKHFAKVVKGKP